jgi:hypothetical protein
LIDQRKRAAEPQLSAACPRMRDYTVLLFSNTDEASRLMAQCFAWFLAFVAVFIPGVKVGSVPIPLAYGVSLGYLIVANPRLPVRYFAIFAVSVTYLSTIAAINASSDAGSARDFLYALLFFGELAVFCSMRDLFDSGHGSELVGAMTLCCLLNLTLMISQAMDLGGMDQGLKGLWEAPLSLFARGDAADLGNADVVQARPYGLMPGFNIASLSMYLVFRAAYVHTGQMRYRLLCLFTILLATARMLMIFFVFYEVILPLFHRKRTAQNLRFSLLALLVCGIAVLSLGFINPNYYIGTFYQQLNNEGIDQNYSLTNRLETINWALENWQRIATIGGVPSDEFRNFSRAVDSEVILRSMQFGLVGFLFIVLMIYGYFHRYRSYDTYFLLAIMLWTSITSSAASNFVICPFLFLYAFACRAVAKAKTAGGSKDLPGCATSILSPS